MFARPLVIAAGLLMFSIMASAAPAPTHQQGAKLVGTDAVGTSVYAGESVALSADGNTAIVGGDYDNTYIGAAWVYTRSGGVWSQQGGKLVGIGATGVAQQGGAVAISADGNTALVGGYADNSNIGATWVFTRTAGVWSQQGTKLVGTGAVGGSWQGFALALSPDGNTALVGGFSDASGVGATWVFTRSAGVWSQQGGKLIGTGEVGPGQQGASVALSADGNTALVGGNLDNGNTGAVWVFTRTAGVWSQQGAKLVGSGATGSAAQGASVALSGDGNTAIWGGLNDNSFAGAAWVFTRSAGIWSQQGSKLVGTGGVGTPTQGGAVSLSGDGNTAIVGANYDDAGKGAAWVYTRSAGVWSQQGAKLVGTGAVGGAYQGRSVSLSADGYTALVGGSRDNALAGAAWVYVDASVLAAPPPGRSPELRLAPPSPNPTREQIAISFSLPRDAQVTLGVFDLTGRSVRSLIAGATTAGDHTVRWDGRTSAGRPAPGGVYFVALRTGGDQLTRRFALLR